MLDPGHGGYDPGAMGPSGTKEKDIALMVANGIAQLAEARSDLQVASTRQSDIYIPLERRAVVANQWEADLFLSIHCNSATNKQARGYEAFTSRGLTLADEAATVLLQKYGNRFPDLRGRHDYADGDPDKEADFIVLRRTRKETPAVLFELEFISSEDGEQWLNSHTLECSEALYAGILQWFDLESDPQVITLPSPIVTLESLDERVRVLESKIL